MTLNSKQNRQKTQKTEKQKASFPERISSKCRLI